MRIHILDQLIANQIAAGEVIERPASIVKELLENSLDAGATELSVEIERGGSQLIRITDNGCGIHKEDLALAVQRHGTSKISELADLEAIYSLGFRGEALASIAVVAKVKISSCAKDADQAWQLVAEGTYTELLEKPTAHPMGTTIEVRELFFNAPVRRKFLRTEKTEFSHIENIIKRIALTNFSLRIDLYHNGKQVLQLLPATTETDREKRIQKILHRGFIQHVLKIDMEATELRLWGWIAQGEFSRTQQDMQYMYINGRIVRDKLINHAIRQAYQAQLTADKYPAYVLFLECNPNIVDVNVHPTKHEVRFREGRLIHDFIYSGLANVLHGNAVMAPAQAETYQEPAFQSPVENVLHGNVESTSKTQTYQQPVFQRPLANVAEQAARYGELIKSSGDESASVVVKESVATVVPMGKPLACLLQKIILVEVAEGLLCVDIAKARAAIITAHLATNKNMQAQPLLFPISLHLNSAQIDIFEKQQKQLQALNFDMDLIDKKQVCIRALPKILQDLSVAEFIPLLLDELAKGKNIQTAIAQQAAACTDKPVNQVTMEKLLTAIQQLPKAQQQTICRRFTLSQLVNS